MLPQVLFSPLDLDDVIDETERMYGARGVVDLLVEALADPRVRDDADIDDYLPTLKSACRQTGRFREIVPVLRRIAALNPDREHEVAAELALVHAHLREPATGIALLEAALDAQRRLPKQLRSFEFFLVAEIAAAVLCRPTLAQQLTAAGRFAVPAPPRIRVRPLFPAIELLPERGRSALALVPAMAA